MFFTKLLSSSSSTTNKLSVVPSIPSLGSILQPRSERIVPAPITVSKTAIEMMMTISNKHEEDIIADLEETKMVLDEIIQFLIIKPIQFLRDAVLVIMTSNPLLQCINKMLFSKDAITTISYAVAFCGSLSAWWECIKFILWNQPPNLEISAIGYAIYKLTIWNYLLFKKGRKPIWTSLIAVLHVPKIILDIRSICSPLETDIIVATVSGCTSCFFAYEYAWMMSQYKKFQKK